MKKRCRHSWVLRARLMVVPHEPFSFFDGGVVKTFGETFNKDELIAIVPPIFRCSKCFTWNVRKLKEIRPTIRKIKR